MITDRPSSEEPIGLGSRFRLPRVESSDPERAAQLHDALMETFVQSFTTARRTAAAQLAQDGPEEPAEGEDPGPAAA